MAEYRCATFEPTFPRVSGVALEHQKHHIGGDMAKFVVELTGKTIKTFEAANYKRAGDQFVFFDSQNIKVGTIVVVPGMSVTRVEES